MKCKYCGAELEEGTKVCPACGEVCDGGETAVLEKKLKTMKLILGAVLAVVLVAALAVVLVMALKEGTADETKESTKDSAVDTSGDASASGGSTEATYLKDGSKDDETCKGTYTVTDDELIAKKDVVVATCGDAQLTNSQLQIYYWTAVYDYISQYYYYMDYTAPLDTQLCDIMKDKTVTWQQACLAQALINWQADQALAQAAAAAEYELAREYQDVLDGMYADFEEDLESMGYETVEEMIQKEMGVCVTYDEYYEVVANSYLGYYYFDELTLDLEVTDEEIETYYKNNSATLEYYYGVTKDSGYLVDIRHILIKVEEDTDAAWETCRTEAQRILDEWLAGEMTEESFAKLAVKYSKDGNAAQGGIYENVVQGQMVETFNDWCFDESRVPGDYGIVETQFGCHIMYFSGRGEEGWRYYARAGVQTEKAADLYTQMIEALPIEVDYESVVLGSIDLG